MLTAKLFRKEILNLTPKNALKYGISHPDLKFHRAESWELERKYSFRQHFHYHKGARFERTFILLQ